MNANPNIREYDLIVILNPELGIEVAKEEMEKIFKELNIKIQNFKNIGRKELQYERKKHKTGIYFEYTLEMEKNIANQLHYRLNIHNNVLQHFLKNLAKQ